MMLKFLYWIISYFGLPYVYVDLFTELLPVLLGYLMSM